MVTTTLNGFDDSEDTPIVLQDVRGELSEDSEEFEERVLESEGGRVPGVDDWDDDPDEDKHLAEPPD